MSKFQIILLAVFGVFIVGAVMLFSVYKGSSASSATVVVWGDISTFDFSTFMTNSGLINDKTLKIQYVEKKRESFDAEFTEALATGTGPDLVILPVSKILKDKNKLTLIPSTSISPKDFSNTFIEEGELFMTSQGTYALPLYVDPIVLYWNRDLFTKAALVAPPKYWDEIYAYSQKLTEKDNAGNIQKSAIALGEARNIPNAKGILSMLMLQAGTPITAFEGQSFVAELTNNFNLPLVPAESALDFYTQFSNPAKPFYSWNRSMLPAQTTFTSGNVAMYLGFASEYKEIKAKNPTLNLGVTTVPQSRVSGKAITFGKMEGVAVVKNSPNISADFSAALAIISNSSALSLSNITMLPPVRRDLLSSKPTDSALSVFYDAAIQSKGWLDPDEGGTNQLFIDMIESVTSGRARVSEAVNKGNNEMNALLK